jgi:putative transposase
MYNNLMNIRRYYFPEQIVFITQVVKERKKIFNKPENIILLKKIIHNVKVLHHFSMLAYVFLPDHFHILIRPTGQSDFSQIMHSIKLNFTRAYKHRSCYTDTLKLWQKRFWDHVIRDEKDLENHIHYIHYNPVRHGYTDDISAWEYSSYYSWRKRGLYSELAKWIEPQDSFWGE